MFIIGIQTTGDKQQNGRYDINIRQICDLVCRQKQGIGRSKEKCNTNSLEKIQKQKIPNQRGFPFPQVKQVDNPMRTLPLQAEKTFSVYKYNNSCYIFVKFFDLKVIINIYIQIICQVFNDE